MSKSQAASKKASPSKALNWEEIAFKIIASAGSAKSSAMEALYAAKAGKTQEITAKLNEAEKELNNAAEAHFEVIQQEAEGKQLSFSVLFMHAEDQLLTTQTLLLLVRELIEVYDKLNSRTKK